MRKERKGSMKCLWAPWRMDYILGEKKRGCLFCKKPKENKNAENLILYQGEYSFVMMNRFPYNTGHLMIIPKRHSVALEELNHFELSELFALLKISIRVLKSTLSPQGFNIGINIGKASGAGEDHIHFHIVPRWTGDTNFMPILGETKVLPDHLLNTYQKLQSAFGKQIKERKGRKGGL